MKARDMARHRCLGMAEGHQDGEEGKEQRHGRGDMIYEALRAHLPFLETSLSLSLDRRRYDAMQ